MSNELNFQEEYIDESPDVADEQLGLTDDPFDEAFNLLDEMDMEYTDDGETVIFQREQDADAEGNESTEEGSAETPDPSQTQTPPAKAEPQHDWENRYKHLQSWSDKVQHENQQLKERLARVEGRIDEMGKGQPQDQETDTLDSVDLSDPQAIKQWMREEVERNTRATIDEILPNADQIRIDNEVSRELQTVIDQNSDFMHYMPAIHRFYQQFPNTTASYQEAYQIVKAFLGQPAQPTQPQPTPQGQDAEDQPTPDHKPSPKESREEALARTKRLHTETSVAANDPTALKGGEVDSIQDAMVAALDEMNN
jgi:hypothetical protein